MGARNVERSDGAVGSAHEAVRRGIRVIVVSRDVARRVDAEGNGAVGARAGSVERSDGALGSAHEAVLTGRVIVVSRDVAPGLMLRGKVALDPGGSNIVIEP
jgi:hypothetical protein